MSNDGRNDGACKKLDDESLKWLVISLAGFWAGFGWVTGPLSWIMAGRLRNDYRVLEMRPSSYATAAWVTGIISTAICVLFAVGLAAILLFVVINVAP